MESEIFPGLNQFSSLALSFHAQFPVPAALKLVERSAACTFPGEDAHALAEPCCQKGSISHYLLGFHRSTLRPICRQPTVLKTEKNVLQDYWCEQQLLDDVMFQAPIKLGGAGNGNMEVPGNPSSLSSLSAPALCASACKARARPALRSFRGESRTESRL